jgi:hypothetical protein
MDDTIRRGRQASEDTLVAAVEAGLVPGVRAVPMGSEAEVEAVYAECAKLPPGTPYVLRVSREVASQGLLGGALMGCVVAGMPENVRGAVMLAFDGWADDPRGLWAVPEVVDFCNGLIYGPDPMNNPDPAHPAMARAVLPFLVDERALVSRMGRQAWDVAGRNWVVSVAHASMVYRGSMRDAGLAMALCDVFLT